MYLVRYPNRTPYYQLVYKKNNKLTSVSTKATTKAAALKFLFDFQERLVTQEKRKPISISKFQDEYLAFITPTKSKSYYRSIQLAFNMLIDHIGNMQLDQIGYKEFENFIIFTFERTKSGASLYYRTLKAAFNKAVDWSYIAFNPLIKVKLPKLPTSLPCFITEQQLNAILEACANELLKDVFVTLFHSGLRAGELTNLKWNDVDLKSRTITIRNTIDFTTKGKKERIIPINDKLFKVLQRRLPKIFDLNFTQYVFYTIPGIKLNVDYISKQFKKSVREAKLDEKIHLHTLRHSFASMLVQKGVSLYVVKELLGHQDLEVTQIYSHLQSQNLVDAVNLL